MDIKQESELMNSYIPGNSEESEKKKKRIRLEIEYAIQDEHKEFKLLRVNRWLILIYIYNIVFNLFIGTSYCKSKFEISNWK